MPRPLTLTQQAALDEVEKNPGTTIKEVAAAISVSYGKAQQALARLERLDALRVERIGQSGNYYFPVEGARPDSEDPLEQLYAAPAYEDVQYG